MAKSLFHNLRRAYLFLRYSSLNQQPFRPVLGVPDTSFTQFKYCPLLRNSSHGSVRKPKFETNKVDPPKKDKWKTKTKLKVQRMRKKQKRKAANKKNPRQLGVKGKKKLKFTNAEEKIKHKLEKVRQIERFQMVI